MGMTAEEMQKRAAAFAPEPTVAPFEPPVIKEDGADRFTPWGFRKPWPETLGQCVLPEFLPKMLDIFRYDPETGYVWNRHSDPTNLGSRLTVIGRSGHGRVNFYRLSAASAKVVWLIHHRRWPDGQLRHRDGNTANDRIENLYEVRAERTRAAGATIGPRPRKNASRGVARCGPDHWQAYVRVGGRQTNLGRFKTEAEAVAARAAYDRGDDLV